MWDFYVGGHDLILIGVQCAKLGFFFTGPGDNGP